MAALGTTYEITIEGEVPASARVELEGLDVMTSARRSTVVGTFEDQAALHGLLDRLMLLGLPLVEVRMSTGGRAPRE